jgi:pilin/secretion family protein with methylation motif
MKRETGFSMIELLISVGIMAAVTASIFGIVNPAQWSFSVQPEAADMQQRLRVAVDTLSRDLFMAGAGSYSGTTAGSLAYYFASILPYRQGAVGDDPIGTYRSDTITLLFVGATDVQTTTAIDLDSHSSTFTVNSDKGCPVGQAACGFEAGDTALIYDGTGSVDTFTLTSVVNDGGTMVVNKPAGSAATTHKAGSKMVKARERTYHLKADAVKGLYQLVYYDAGSNADIPVADHVVGLEFEYYGDPQPPTLKNATCDPNAAAPCSSYGPQPPALGVQTTAYPAGENCAFTVDPASGLHVPRLEIIGGDPSRSALVLLTQAQLTDGPWCPDADNANHFDADLFRVRKVAVTLRVEAAVDAMRGPASALFTRGGTAKNAAKFLPDQEISFQISPRNLNFGR